MLPHHKLLRSFILHFRASLWLKRACWVVRQKPFIDPKDLRPQGTELPLSFVFGSPKKYNSMKLLSLIIYRWQEDNSLELVTCEELTSFSFFHRGPLREHIKFHSRLIATRTPPGQRQSIDFDQNLGKCYSWSHPEANGPTLTATVLVDGSGLVYHKGSLKEALKGALKGSA
ncbi:YKT6 [Symbiodinium microadriaticum]|nr:YKT6 [Symbiodinium microadriaticum]